MVNAGFTGTDGLDAVQGKSAETNGDESETVEEDPGGETTVPTETEDIIANTGYSIGMAAGYGVGVEVFGAHNHADFVHVLPSVSFPLSGVMGGSFYRGVLEYKIEPVFGLMTNLDNRVEAGLSPVGLRYNFTALDGPAVPYFEVLLGGVYINTPRGVHAEGFNFIESAAVGVRYFLTERTAVDIGARFRHLSNAGIREPNGGLNNVFLLVGLSYY